MSAKTEPGSTGVARVLRQRIYLTDGTRSVLLRQVTWHNDDIYLTDPNNPDSGKVSWHKSGDLNLGQPTYSPQKVVMRLPPPSAVHGYASPLLLRINTHGLGSLLSRPEKYPPTPDRHSTFIDIRNQPSDTRFLALEVGVRCALNCHLDARLPYGRGLVQDLVPNGNRFLVISAWWEPLLTLTSEEFESELMRAGVGLEEP